jgi:hypothetical protein
MKFPDDNQFEPPPVRVSYEAVQFGPGVFRSTNADVEVLPHDTPTSSLGELLKLSRLQCYVLSVVCRADLGEDLFRP